MGGLTLVLPVGVARYQACLVRDYDPSANPYRVKVATSCDEQKRTDGEKCGKDCMSLVGIIGDRVILYDGQRTIALRRDDVKSIEWEAAAIQARRSWWCPPPCALAAFCRGGGTQ